MRSYRPAIIGLKLLDMLVLSVYYFVIGFFIASAIDWFFGKFDSENEDKKSTLWLFAEAIFYTFCLVFVYYIVRNVVERIPFPFDGLYGFRHELVKERSGDVVFVFVLFFYQQYYVDKLKYLHRRLQQMFQVTDRQGRAELSSMTGENLSPRTGSGPRHNLKRSNDTIENEVSVV